jgi:hypothetical protein
VGKGRKRPQQSSADRRAALFEQLGTASATSRWAQSGNPVKKRIAALEVAWREALQWLFEDIQKMFGNFSVIGDAYDDLDMNVAALKALMIEKGVITEDEFQAKKKYFVGVLNKERRRRQSELQNLQRHAEEEAKRVAEAEEAALDGSTVSSELKRMHKAALETGKNPELPSEATIFGGG